MEEEGEKPEEEAPAPGQPPAAARSPLETWGAPAFWMACGAVLAGLAGGAVLLAQRVSVERDMAALAGTLPPPPAPTPTSTSTVTPAMPPPAAVPAPPPAPAMAASPAIAAAPAPPPAAAPMASPPAPTAAGEEPRAKRAPERRLRAAREASVSKRVAVEGRKPVARAKAKAGARRKAKRDDQLDWVVFKRCPLPGEPGAVECRRHICNGAESEGPACKPYRRRWR